MMVMRTYTTGLSVAHVPRNERNAYKKKIGTILTHLSKENLRVCQTYNETAVKYLTNETLLDSPVLTASVTVNERGKGKFGVNALMKECGEAANHLHSGMNQLHTATKGYVDRIQKGQQVLQWLSEYPEEEVQWVFWTRSTTALDTFKRQWNLSFHYLDPLMRGIHHKFFGDSLPALLPPLAISTFIHTAEKKITELQEKKNRTRGETYILDSLALLVAVMKEENVSPLFECIPTGWKKFKEWVKTLPLPSTSSLTQWSKVLRLLCSQCYLEEYTKMRTTGILRDIRTGTIRECFALPFSPEERTTHKKQKQIHTQSEQKPYLVISGPKYVIRRKKNSEALHALRTEGVFPLHFKYLHESWKNSIVAYVRASKKIRQIVQHPEVKLQLIILFPPRERTGDGDVQLVFSGPLEAFVATRHLSSPLALPPRQQLAVDLNRRGPFMAVSSFNLPLPPLLVTLLARWEKVEGELSKYQTLLASTSSSPASSFKRSHYLSQLRLHFRRRKNLRQTCHQMIANWIGQQLVSSGAQTLVLESLTVHTYGTSKALARAIEQLADDLSLYAREVVAVQVFTGRPCRLVTLSPAFSSRLHVGCGGRVDRSPGQYDHAPCLRCGMLVNTHHNAALFLEQSFLSSS